MIQNHQQLKKFSRRNKVLARKQWIESTPIYQLKTYYSEIAEEYNFYLYVNRNALCFSPKSTPSLLFLELEIYNGPKVKSFRFEADPEDTLILGGRIWPFQVTKYLKRFNELPKVQTVKQVHKIEYSPLKQSPEVQIPPQFDTCPRCNGNGGVTGNCFKCEGKGWI